MSGKEKTINIVMAADNNYSPWMGILIMSIIKNTPCKVYFHIIDGGITEQNRKRIEFLGSSSTTQFNWYRPDHNNYTGFPIKRYGIATYYRLSMASILPESLETIIYLDCDMLAVDDLPVLANILDDGQVLAAVEDISAPRTEIGFEQHEYFNAGTLVIDMKLWRKNDYEEKLLKLMQERGDELKYLDQDALNIVFRNQWQKIPLQWNFQPGIWRRAEKKQYGPEGTTRADYEHALKNPAIIHFLARRKPWIYGCIHPLKKVYLEYLKQSPWSELYPRPNSPREVVQYYSGIDKLFKQQKRWLQMKKFL